MKFENMILKFIHSNKGSKIAKTLLKRWNKSVCVGDGSLLLIDIKIYYKANAIKTVWH